jgi:uncharacterized membrane protein YbhN (UPF0104 family)
VSPPIRHALLAGRVLLGGVLFWLVASHTGGWEAAGPVLTAPALLWPVVIFSLAGAYLESLRLMPLLRSQRVALTLGEAFRLVTAAFAFNFCIPGGASGDLSKVYYLNAGAAGKGWEMATVVFVDRLVGLFSMLLTIVVLGAFCWPFLRTSPIFVTLFAIAAGVLAGILVFAAFCLTTRVRVHAWVRKVLGYLPFGAHLQRIAQAFFHFSGHRDALAWATLHSLLGNVAAVAMFTVLGWTLFPALQVPFAALLSLFGMFGNAITITPGGLGVGEAAFDRLFDEAGLRGGAAMMIVWRIGMVPMCLLGLGFYLRGIALRGRDAPPRTQDNGHAR